MTERGGDFIRFVCEYFYSLNGFLVGFPLLVGFRFGLESTRLFHERRRAERKRADGDHDYDIRKHESVIAHAVNPHVVQRGIFRKGEHARKHVGSEA